MKLTDLFAGAATALALGGALPAHAISVVLPPADFTASARFGDAGPNNPSIVNEGAGPQTAAITDVAGGVSASAKGLGGVLLNSTASSSATGYGGEASATVDYKFAVIGPTDVLVPVLVNAELITTGSFTNNIFDSTASLEVSDSIWSLGCQNYNCGPESMQIHDIVWVSSNTPIIVFEQANTEVYDQTIFNDQGITGHASADPFFSIDPTFLDQNPGYSLAFSEGVDNVQGGVPEPATWALMICGLGLAGGALRARRQTLTA